MSKLQSFRLLCMLVLSGLSIILFSSGVEAQSAENDFPDGLFADYTSRSPVTIDETAARSRTVSVDIASLNIDTPQQEAATVLPINLFDDVQLVARLNNVQRNPSESVIWSGQLDGDTYSHINLVVRDGIMIGSLAYGIRQYEIRMSPEGVQYVMEVNPSAFPEQETDYIPVTGQSVSPRNAPTRGIDDGSIMDVIVGYTPEAKAGAGGQAAIEATIELAMQETNTGYANSGATQRIMLVHMFETADSEDGKSVSTILGEWRTRDDGRFDEVFALRDTYHADFVHIITEVSGCGVAYFQSTPNDASFENWAFGQTTRGCATGGYTYGHELGHNMGLAHDWYVSDGTNPYPYAHGFTNYQDSWRTIMAYNSRCDAANGSCARILFFSNPNKLFGGDPMGVAGTTPANCTAGSTSPEPQSCVANATSVLNSQAASNSQFRVSQITWTGNSGSNWNDAGNWEIVQGAANRPGGSTTTVNRVPLSIDDVVIPSGLANYPTISSGSMTAREMIIESGATLDMSGGTLTMTGVNWEEQGTGQFNGTGGTVVFNSTLDQTITANANSTFNHVQFGNGNTQKITLASDIDINGNVTLISGVSLVAESYTINVAGNWDDQASGFLAGTSTVVFDGTVQTVDKVTTRTLISEDFSSYVGCGCSSGAPAGWARTGDGSAFLFGNSQMYHWHNSTDAWIFTLGVALEPGVAYTFSFDHSSWSQATSNLTIAYGSTQDAAGMTTTLGTLSDAQISTSPQNSEFSFSVATAGTYYLGVRSEQNGYYTFLDTFSLVGVQDLSFYNLQVASGETDFNESVVVNNNLQTNANAVADIGVNTISVEGAVTNNGSIKQTKSVANGVMSEFGRIKNAAGSTDKYYGVELTPSTGAMGSTVVEIKGAQNCDASADVGNGVQRCYVITPTTNQTASARFYYRSAETNSNADPDVFLQTGARIPAATWTRQTTSSHGGSGEAVWAEAALTSYGTFALAESGARVTLSGGAAQDEGDSGNTTYTFTATLDVAVSGGFSVPYSTSDGTATTGDSDYTANSGTLNFAGTIGEVKTFTVIVTGDTRVESDETFNVALGTPSNADVKATASPQTATITNDDEATVTLSGGTTLDEGDSGATSLTFTATLDVAVVGGFTVVLNTVDGTATSADSDYTALNQTLSFSGTANETKTATVSVTGDETVELDESFSIQLGSPSNSGVMVAASPQTVTLSNDDAASFAIENVTLAEGNSGTTNYTFNVTLNAAVDSAVSVDFASADDTAMSSDYTAKNGTLNFTGTANETKSVTIAVAGDRLIEPDEQFFVNLSNKNVYGRNVSISDAQGVGTITNDDNGAELSINFSTGAPGSNFIVSGMGFAPNTSVALTLTWPTRSTSLSLGTVNTDSSGSFVLTVQTADHAPVGAYAIEAVDNSDANTSGDTTFTLSESASTHTQTGGTTTVSVGLPFRVHIPIVIR